MRKFWFSLWVYWGFWLSLFSLAFGVAGSMLITLGLYLLKGMPSLSPEIWQALADVFTFWFKIVWSVGLPLGLLLVVKRLFYRCYDHFQMHFLQCPSRTELRDLSVRDTTKLWRKWLFSLVWIVATQIIIVVAVHYFRGAESLMGWFNVYWLYGFILIGGAVTLPLMGARCKMVQVKRC